MLRPLDRVSLARILAFVWLAVMLGLAPGSAQSESRLADVRDELESRYEILELSRGYLLRPTDGTDDFETLEILDGRVAIDGVSVDGDALRRYVDEDAELILALAGLAESGLPDPPTPPEPPFGDDFPDEESGAEEGAEHEDAKDERDEDETRYRHDRDDTRVSFGTSLVIDEDERVRDVVLLAGQLDVRGEVDGDATVVGGSAEVTGKVDGSLVVVGGSVRLGPEAVIDGDVVAVGGPVRRASGSVIDGEVVQVDFGDHFDFGDVRIDTPTWTPFGDPWSSGWEFIGNAFGIFFLLLILVPFLFIAPHRTDAVGRRALREPWKAGLVGVVIEVLFLPALLLVFVVLMVSIVGIPLVLVVIPLLVLALGIYFLMGMAGVSVQLGRWLDKRFGWGTLSPYVLLVLGVIVVQGWALLGDLLSFLPWPIRISALLLVVLGLLTEYLAWTIGLGAAVLHQFSPRTADDGYAGPAFADPYGEAPRAPVAEWQPEPPAEPEAASEGPDPEDQRRPEDDDEQLER